MKQAVANLATTLVLSFIGLTTVWLVRKHFYSKSTPARLTPDDLVQRMRLNNSQVVSEIYSLANRQLEVEDGRDASLSSKAATLLSASGVSLTFVLGFAALFAQKKDFFDPVPGWARACMLLFYAVSFFAGLGASIFAAESLRVRGKYRTISEGDVLGEILRDAENACNPQGEPDDALGATIYKRFLVAHLWQIYTTSFDIHEDRARVLWRGQLSFVIFLVTLVPPALGVAYAMAKAIG